jgi:hypothetical protein
VTGVRLVLAYSTGRVRGQVQVVGGTLPEGTRMDVSAYGEGASISEPSEQVDAHGSFLIEGLAAGAYTLMLHARLPRAPTAPVLAKQKVTVAVGAETAVILTVDLSRKEQEQ